MVDKTADEYIFRKGVPWKERKDLIADRYPSIVELDWKTAFDEDPGVLGRIVNDMLRLEAPQSRPGKRPALDPKVAEDRYNKLFGEDYSEHAFPKAFELLKGKRSLRHVANNTNIDKMTVSTLLAGKRPPRVEEMISIAEGLGKHPSYFLEYRAMYVLSFLNKIFETYPEMGVVQYEKLRARTIDA